jgi:transposase
MADIAQGLRERVIALSQHTDKTHREIGEAVGVNHSTVTRIINHYLKTGSTATLRKGHCGRKGKLSERDKKAIIRESKKDPRASAHSVQAASGMIAANVSLRTIQRTLVEGGRLAYRPRKVHFLDKGKCKNRFQWAKQHMHLSQDMWDKVSNDSLL